MTREDQRKEMISLSNKGMKAPQIVAQIGCSVWTVRKWIQRLKKSSLVSIMGRPKSVPLGSFDEAIRNEILNLRLNFSDWGPGTIWIELSQKQKI